MHIVGIKCRVMYVKLLHKTLLICLELTWIELQQPQIYAKYNLGRNTEQKFLSFFYIPIYNHVFTGKNLSQSKRTILPEKRLPYIIIKDNVSTNRPVFRLYFQ